MNLLSLRDGLFQLPISIFWTMGLMGQPFKVKLEKTVIEQAE